MISDNVYIEVVTCDNPPIQVPIQVVTGYKVLLEEPI